MFEGWHNEVAPETAMSGVTEGSRVGERGRLRNRDTTKEEVLEVSAIVNGKVGGQIVRET